MCKIGETLIKLCYVMLSTHLEISTFILQDIIKLSDNIHVKLLTIFFSNEIYIAFAFVLTIIIYINCENYSKVKGK